MSQFLCHCGFVSKDTLYPSPTEGWILREEDNDAFWDDIMVGIKEFLTAKDRGELAQ